MNRREVNALRFAVSELRERRPGLTLEQAVRLARPVVREQMAKAEPAVVAICAHCGEDITEGQDWIDGRWPYHTGCAEQAEYEASLLRGRPHEFYD